MNKHKNNKFGPLKGIDEECKNGLCLFSLQLIKYESAQDFWNLCLFFYFNFKLFKMVILLVVIFVLLFAKSSIFI